MRKEREEEYTALRNSKALLNIEQNVELLTEKMSSFESKNQNKRHIFIDDFHSLILKYIILPILSELLLVGNELDY